VARSASEISGGWFVHLSEAAHQATLASGGIIFVDDAFFGGFIQGADGSQRSCPGVFRGTSIDGSARVLYECASFSGEQTVAQAALVVLFDAFYCRFGISQLGPPKSPSLSRQAILLDTSEFVQLSLTPNLRDGKIRPLGTRPHRLGDQDAALSRLKPQFESGWGQRA
jgi:hypothetical protein